MSMISLSVTVTHVNAFSTDLPKTIFYCILINSLFHCSMCCVFFPLVMIHRCASTLAWKHFMFISPNFFLNLQAQPWCHMCYWDLNDWCIMGNSLLFVFVSFQRVGKNTLLIFSTVSPDFHNVSNDERELNASQIAPIH